METKAKLNVNKFHSSSYSQQNEVFNKLNDAENKFHPRSFQSSFYPISISDTSKIHHSYFSAPFDIVPNNILLNSEWIPSSIPQFSEVSKKTNYFLKLSPF